MTYTDKDMIKNAGILLLYVCLTLLTACEKKQDTLYALGVKVQSLQECLAEQELIGECAVVAAEVSAAKISALSAGHTQENIEATIQIIEESATDRNLGESTYRKVKRAFLESRIPLEPDASVFKLFSSKYTCNQAIEAVGNVFQWQGRGLNAGRLVFTFSPSPELRLARIFSPDSTPCFKIDDYHDGIAFITESQFHKLKNEAKIVLGYNTDYKVFNTQYAASAYFKGLPVIEWVKSGVCKADDPFGDAFNGL